MENKTFYMVYLEEQSTPTYKHTDFDSAKKEAKRLAHHFNKKAYVLVTVLSVELDLFKVEDLRPICDFENPLPF